MKIQTEATISSSHFVHTTGFNNPCQKLHGHNWRIVVEVDGVIAEDGMVVDFKKIKEFINKYDHKVLVPKHMVQQCIYQKENYQLTHNYKWYSIPKEDIELLSIDAITSEHLADYLKNHILNVSSFFDVKPNFVKVTVYETPTSFAVAEE